MTSGQANAPEKPQTRDPQWVGVTGLQCELRNLFATLPIHRALSTALKRIAQSLGGRYAVVHARFGAQLLSEEWVEQGTEINEELRESVNEAMWMATDQGTAQCTRSTREGSAVAAALMYDQDVEQTGAAAVLFHEQSRDDTLRVLAQFEGMVGFLALLVTGQIVRRQGVPSWSSSDLAQVSSRTARHPMRLAFSVAAELKNRHGFELTAVGFVRGSRVDVMAVCGLDDVRASNPGVKLIQAAMEECLDRREAVLHHSPAEQAPDEQSHDYRLHARWGRALGDKSVASIPLKLHDEVVAVVAVTSSTSIHHAQIQEISESPEMVLYGALVPLSCEASRGVGPHIAAATRDGWVRLVGGGRRRTVTLGVLALGVVAWLLFGSLSHTFAVPCVVKAANRRVVSCPRDGVLADLFVKPGDLVDPGQLLAVLDSHDDLLHRLEIEAQISAAEADADAALAQRDFSLLRVLNAQKAALMAQLSIVESAIKQAEIRAPQAAVVLNGDLREQLGSRITRGDPMFELSRYDQTIVVLKIPEARVLAARRPVSVTFAPTAQPDARVELGELRLAPASTVMDGQNVFLGEALANVTIEGLAPGMEGVAHVDAGPRAAWWVISHRFVDWLRLNFWL